MMENTHETKQAGGVIRWILWCLGGLAGLVLLMGLGGWLFLRASLPILDGSIRTKGVAAEVTVTRDRMGVPAISGRNREDVAYALGFLHAQERFFQMDSLRRAAAGELAALMGPGLLPIDRINRVHRFRARAEAAVARLPAQQRLLLERYTAGVNDGLDALHARPFEYALLRSRPEHWQPADTLLVIYAMYLQLESSQGPRLLARTWLKDNVTAEQAAFLLPESSRYDAPLDAALVSLPAPALPHDGPSWFAAASPPAARMEVPAVGSNSYALSGRRTVDGAAVVENDMHMGIGLPNIWYRAELIYPDPANGSRKVIGVTLPGTPLVVIGSNGAVAWGFTNSFGDYMDLVELDRDPADPRRVHVAGGWETLAEHAEVLYVHGGPAEKITVRECSLGPVLQLGQHIYAVHWVAYEPGAANLALGALESASTVEEAQAVASRSGMPALNMLAGDRSGQIGWTIAGSLPDREPGMVSTFAFKLEDRPTWSALLPPDKHPRILNPADGQLWSANSRQLAGPAYQLLGDGGDDLGARAQQLRDDLTSLARADEKQVYEVSLDDRALFMSSWRDRALRILDDAAVAGHARRAQFRRLLKTEWNGHASTSSVGYRLARAFYDAIYVEMFGELDRHLQPSSLGGGYALANKRWPVVAERLLDEAPAGWLPAGRTWRELELAAVDHAIASTLQLSPSLAQATWGSRNRARIAHPFARAVAFLGGMLSAPPDPLPGDDDMPRVAGPAFGSTERFVVSPGQESRGIFNMPGGQSGHPLSPYFLAGHEAWVRGEATPLLPGDPVHKLVFAVQ